MGVKDDLTSLHANLASSGEQLDFVKKEAEAQYYQAVRTHLLDGNSFAEVIHAADNSGVEKEKVAEYLSSVTTKLIEDGIASLETLETVTNDKAEFKKLSSRILDETHPLVVNLRVMFDCDMEIEKVAVSLDTVEDALKNVKAFINENFLAN